jgi:hypothetical protein
VRHPEEIKAEYETVLGQVPGQFEECCDRPKARELLNRTWALVGAWISSYLNDHPGASGDELVVWGNKLTGSTSAVQVASGQRAAYVVAANVTVADVPISTFFIVARNADGRFEVVWNVKDVAEKGDQLGSWAELSQAFVFNGPLTGTVHQLPPSRTGAARFYVDARANPASGSNTPKQISIWEWTGKQPVALLIGDYLVTKERGECPSDC